MSGIADLKAADRKLNVKTAGTPECLLFNTGEMTENKEWADFNKSKTEDQQGNMKVNEMIVYDEAQAKVRFLVHVKFEFE
jgi:hypothetical protein